jgi:uncharacterized protein YndB with AHSA1/START domain
MSEVVVHPAPVRKSIVVKADLDRSFSAFTSGIGRWWPRSKSIGATAQVDVVLEGRAGGRWYERGTDGAECEWGKVLLWEPPARVVLAWQIGSNWKYDPALLTEVEVTFTALAGGGATRVDVEHRHLERFGTEAARLRDAFDSEAGWNGVLKSFASVADLQAP